MVKEEEIRICLKGMGVESLGIYILDSTTYIAIHCNSEETRRKAKELLEFYLVDGEIIL